MGVYTKIPWCDSTINPTSGCDGCELFPGPCYAGYFHEMRLAKAMPDLYAESFGEVRLIPGRMAKAARWPDMRGKRRTDKPWFDGMPRVVFVGDMGDVLSADVSFEYLRDDVFSAIASGPGERHLWMVLTKRPARLAEFALWYVSQGLLWPENLICGTSVTTQATASRVRALLGVPGRLFVSAEPLRESIDLAPYLGRGGIELVICGGESRQGSHPVHPFDVAWARTLRDQCGDADTCFFMKQYGAISGDGATGAQFTLRDPKGGNRDEWPDDLRVREFPRVAAAVAP